MYSNGVITSSCTPSSSHCSKSIINGDKVWGTFNLIPVDLWFLTSDQPRFPTSLSADSELLEEAPSLRRVSSEIAQCQTVWPS